MCNLYIHWHYIQRILQHSLTDEYIELLLLSLLMQDVEVDVAAYWPEGHLLQEEFFKK